MPGLDRRPLVRALAPVVALAALAGCVSTPVPPADLVGLANTCVERNGFTDPVAVPPIITGQESAQEALVIASVSNGLSEEERAVVADCMSDAGA